MLSSFPVYDGINDNMIMDYHLDRVTNLWNLYEKTKEQAIGGKLSQLVNNIQTLEDPELAKLNSPDPCANYSMFINISNVGLDIPLVKLKETKWLPYVCLKPNISSY